MKSLLREVCHKVNKSASKTLNDAGRKRYRTIRAPGNCPISRRKENVDANAHNLHERLVKHENLRFTDDHRGREPGYPPHRTGRALFAPPSGPDKALVWPRVADAGSVGSGEGVYVPGEVLLGASPKGTQLFALVYELLQAASWNGVVAAVDNSPLGRFVPVIVPPPAQGLLDPPQGARLRDGLRPTLNLPFLVCSQKCVMPRKSNVLPCFRRFALANRPNSMIFRVQFKWASLSPRSRRKRRASPRR